MAVVVTLLGCQALHGTGIYEFLVPTAAIRFVVVLRQLGFCWQWKLSFKSTFAATPKKTLLLFKQSLEVLVSGASEPVRLNSKQVSVTGQFVDYSFGTRAQNFGIELTVTYRNPDNISDYQATLQTNSNYDIAAK